jgi:glycosyltransferase involved in cell wall biosynthesis
MSLNILLKGQLRFLNQFYEVTAISGMGRDLAEVEEREQVKTHIIEMQRQISPLRDLVSLYKLYIYFKKEKPDIIHSITPKAGLLSMLAAKLAGVPIRIHTFTGLVFPSKSGLMQRLLINMDRLLCSFATHIYPEGNGVKQDLISYKITNKPLNVLANGNVNGIDTAYFNRDTISFEQQQQLRKTLDIKPSDFVFIFVGRLVSDKGINEIVSAFKQIQPLFSKAKLLMVGGIETELDALLPETLNEIEYNKSIITTGYQDDVRPFFAISNVLVFPSYREGFPNVVLQAGAMELASIVSDINGCNEIIMKGENGIIVPPKNETALKTAMIKLMEDEILWAHLKQNARVNIVAKYEQSLVWKAILEEYKNLEIF